MHKKLSHISQEGSFIFVTFRTQDSIDKYIQNLSSQNLPNNKLHYLIDKHLDSSTDGAYLYKEALKLTKEYLLHIESELCEIVAFSIMPNHIHLLIIEKKPLASIMKQIKGALAFKLNKELQREGKFWQKAYFDKTIRDEKHLSTTLEYIQNNALKAGLSDADERFYFNEDVVL